MPKTRVHELAAELGLEVKVVLARLKEIGEYVRSASSTIEAPVANKLRESFGVHDQRPEPGTSPALRTQDRPHQAAAAFDATTPSARQFGWRAGAVKRPQHPDLLNNIERVSKRFPAFRDHIDALARLGSQIVYAGMCLQEAFRGCAVAHVRFSGAIEAGFGFTREVMLFYSPYEDLQARTFEAAVRELKGSDRSVTPDTFFMWSPDQRLRVKLNDWSRPSRLAIPLLIEAEDDLSLITLLRDYVYARDLFYITTPVHGASFFGRKTLLQSLRGDALSQRVSGIFGLRKSGKTSILMQLKEQLQEDKVVTILMDLETFPSPPEDPTDDLVAELRRRLIAELKAHNLRTRELSETSSRPTILELKNALQDVLKSLNRDGNRVLLLLDEIEYLTPADRIDIAEGDMPRIAQLLSALRSIVQETENFTFILSGLTSAIIEGGRLYGRPNPLFSWAKGIYVKPFSREEADDLAGTVGGKMGIQIEPGALEALHEASGGHAFLYRNLSSAVVANLPKNDFQRTMTRAAVLRELGDWKSRVRGNIEEMIQHVKRYYATEAVLLELLMEHPNDFRDLVDSEPVAVRRLKDLGLIYETNGEFEVNVILELL
ncbi:translation initiation factor IF-2 N-terminal domain-containing protein [Phytoactinopolyspora halotolerans]|uniref:AAA family ATPase n=1 Tax=Phytoactinopolyspora halotolerans TaxID=1981512 RepID=A0A6L9SFE9_9ACTN|nr:translation initiation factor IF-2 N-terminal domain-containing protein [Phytoactinopolyspora halotolerans]NEE03839.1 AAA family ATPase [Phytoactinopolyspora halotolerans]